MQELNRILDFKDILFIGLTDIIGSGLFVAFATALLNGGSNIFYAIITVAISSIISGLSYSEIVSIYKSNISDISIIKQVFGESYGNIISIMSFIFGILSASFMLLALSKYIFNNRTSGKLFSLIIITIIFFINYHGIELSKNVINIVSTFIVLIIVFIIIYGLLYINIYDTFNINATKNINNYLNKNNGIYGFLISCTFIIFLFAGYSSIIKLHDEVNIDCIKSIPNSIIISISISFIIYISMTYLILKIFNNNDKFEDFTLIPILYKKLLGSYFYYIIYYLCILIVISTAFTILLSESRYMYGLSKENILPDIFSSLSKYKTPTYTIFLSFIICCFIILIDNDKLTLDITNIFTIIILISVNMSIVLYRYYNMNSDNDSDNKNKDEYKMPLYYKDVPILPIVNSIFLFILLIVCFTILPSLLKT